MRLYALYWLKFSLHLCNGLYRTTFPVPTAFPAPPAAPNLVLRKQLACTERAFNFTVEFERPFHGIIYTEGSTASRCVYVEGWTNPRTAYNVIIPIDSCGSLTTRNGSLYQTVNTFLVQRDPRLIEVHDNAYTVVCQRFYTQGNSADFLDDNSATNVATMIYERYEVVGPREEVITKLVNEVISNDMQFGTRLSLGEEPDGPLPEKPVQLGERMTFSFFCTTNATGDNFAPQKDCTVGECVARDPGGNRKVQLSDQNGCSSHPSVWSNFLIYKQQRETGVRATKILIARVSAWSFPTSSHVLISCRARLCDESCGEPKCERASTSESPSLQNGFELAENVLQQNISARPQNSRFTGALPGLFSNDDPPLDKRDRLALDDAVVAYKVEKTATSNEADPQQKRLCPPDAKAVQAQKRVAEEVVRQHDGMIIADAPRLLLPLFSGPNFRSPPMADSGQLAETSSNANDNNSNSNSNSKNGPAKKCVAMEVFVGLISTLLAALGVMTFVIVFLMWKLHKYARRATMIRIEKRTRSL